AFLRAYRSLAADDEAKSNRHTLFYLRLSNFNLIFDRRGTRGISIVLRALAARIHETVNVELFVGKLSDSHFALVFESESISEAPEALATKLLSRLNTPLDVFGHQVLPEVDVSVTTFLPATTAFDELIANAELALTEPQLRTRPSVRVYSPVTRRDFDSGHRLVRDIERGIAEREFEPWFQPKVTLGDQVHIGFEALIRWRHPKQGLVEPARFLPQAERWDLLGSLTLVMLEKTASAHRQWQRQGLAAGPIALNIPTAVLAMPSLLDEVLEGVKRCNQLGQRIDIELTEGVLIESNLQQIRESIARFRAAGAHIALDDFGTGFASLTHLMNLECDQIKLDCRFVRDCTTSVESRSIVEAVLGIASNLDMTSIAEGIEHPSQSALLRSMGCQQGQGFLYSRPLSFIDATTRLMHSQGLAEAFAQTIPPLAPADSFSRAAHAV
ncbi:MAG: GGDEF domain-containing phosphodiesterase, partial [Pseudomonadota bacterium]